MADRLHLAVASIGAGRLSTPPQQRAVLREAGFFDRPLVNGPGGPGPAPPEPGRRGRPEPPRRKQAPPLWQRLVRGVSVASGASTLVFLLYEDADPATHAAVAMTFGMPGTLLIGMLAIVLIAVGAGG